MPRYEFKEGSSSKFWEITLDGTSFTTRYGKIGTDGQETSKDWPSAGEAKKQYDKLIAEKVKKGYTPADGDGGGDGDDSAEEPEAKAAAPAKAAAGGAATAKKKAAPEPTQPAVPLAKKSAKSKATDAASGGGGAAGGPTSNAELELTIDKEADNVEAYQVLADWLQSHGDPRGELIAVAISAATSKDSKLKSREKTLRENQMGALSEHVKSKALALTYKYGLIETARLHLNYETETEKSAPEILTDLCTHPLARFLRSLRLGIVYTDGENEYSTTIKALTKAGPRSALRELFIGDFKPQEDTEMSWSYITDMQALYPLLPRLRSLTLQSGNIELGKAPIALAPRLRSLEIRTGGLDAKTLGAVVKTSWPKLEKLVLWFGDSNYGAESTLASIKPILDGTNFPAMKALGLMNAEFTDEICGALVDAKVLPQLKSVDLSMGVMTDDGASALAKTKAAFKHLELINLSNNFLSAAGIKSVAGLCGQVVTGGQRNSDGEEERYVAVGE